MDPFSVSGEGLSIRATQDDTRGLDGVFISIDDALRKQRCGLIIEPHEARALAAWLLSSTPAVPDPSPGRYCATCRHVRGRPPLSMCHHPVTMHVCPVLGEPVGMTAQGMRATCAPCGPAGNLWAARDDGAADL